MKSILVFVVIVCMALFVMAQEQEIDPLGDKMNDEPSEIKTTVMPEPTVLPVTRLNITLIDEVNDQVIKLENAIVQIIGELHIAEDSFNYSNTFVEGDRYTMTIWIKLKK